MADLTVMRTNGTAFDMVKELEGKNVIHLFLTYLENPELPQELSIGHVLTNEGDARALAVIAVEERGDKATIPCIRLACLNLLKHLVVHDKSEDITIVISKNQFSGRKEELNYICTIREFLTTYFSEAITTDTTLIITDYAKELIL